MLVREARAVAAAWVAGHAAPRPDFRGALLTGSTTALPLDAPLPATSDVDVVVVVAGEETPPKPGKIPVDGVLVEVTYLALAAIATPADVPFPLAPSFVGDHLLADPTGHLARLRAAIAPGFATPAAVRRRYEEVLAAVDARLGALEPTAPWPELVTAWLFPTSLTAVVPLVAALRPPTVRLRYAAARAVLAPDPYAHLLALLGCADRDAPLVRRHLDATAELFDRAAAVARTPFPFSADLTAAARPVAIDGSRDLVGRGDHREAVFWIVATAARAQTVLAVDDPPQARRTAPAFATLVGELVGLDGPADVLTRRDRVRAALPELRAVAGRVADGVARPPSATVG